MSAETTSSETTITPNRTMPAWVLSVIVHVVLLLLATLLVVDAGGSGVTAEPGRSVGIVLSHPASESREYFSESDAEQAQEQSADSSTPAVAAAASTPDSLVLEELALPTLEELRPGAGAELAPPRLQVSGRKANFDNTSDTEAIMAVEAARKQALAARGPTTKLGLFGGAEAEGRTFLFLVDRSTSMGGQGLDVLDATAAELMRAVATLQPNHRFTVVVYHDRCIYLNDRRELIRATEENKAGVGEFLSTKAALGTTLHLPAIMSVLEKKPDVLFVLTDGGDPYLTEGQIRRITKHAQPTTAIHCIHFGSGPLQDPDHFLRRLAAANRGEYGYVDARQRRP